MPKGQFINFQGKIKGALSKRKTKVGVMCGMCALDLYE